MAAIEETDPMEIENENIQHAEGLADFSLPWVEKYRPKSFDQLMSHEQIIQTLERLVEKGSLPHLLLYGPPGTGKTSTIMALSRRLYQDNYKSMMLELNASDDRGIEVVRERIKDFASTRTIYSKGPKLILLDEADNMTSVAQSALRRVIEKYSKNCRFCLVCNFVSKIIPALQSRCTRFRFSPLPLSAISAMIDRVVANEHIKVTADGIKAVKRLSRGDMRKCLNILQSASMAFNVVDEKAVYLCTGNPLPADIEKIAHLLLNESVQKAYNDVKSLQIEKGIALADIVRDIYIFTRRMPLKPAPMAYLLSQLSDIEYRLAGETNELVQLSSLIGVFMVARDMQTAQ